MTKDIDRLPLDKLALALLWSYLLKMELRKQYKEPTK